uniref:Uncharacterized protein n=1 Tax=Branchiostoma floridae TaxID=7739 RepID=C3Y5Z0_BRAFL|eukprot:XP_002608377.1 hypothetical protein BRAFLDRAFT_91336 [Branchiostoma floridae]
MVPRDTKVTVTGSAIIMQDGISSVETVADMKRILRISGIKITLQIMFPKTFTLLTYTFKGLQRADVRGMMQCRCTSIAGPLNFKHKLPLPSFPTFPSPRRPQPPSRHEGPDE